MGLTAPTWYTAAVTRPASSWTGRLSAKGTRPSDVAELEILDQSGPLCVAGVWDWRRRRLADGLYFIYSKRHGFHFGPFYASIPLAAKGMKKALAGINRSVWDQPLEWLRRQVWLAEWIEKNLGRGTDLVGGEWAK